MSWPAIHRQNPSFAHCSMANRRSRFFRRPHTHGARVLDLVQAVRGLELELVLVDPLREKEAALAGRHRGAVDDLHAVERLAEAVEIGADVADEEQVGVGGLVGDAVLEKLKRGQRVLVEAGPERLGGRAEPELLQSAPPSSL